MIQLGLKQGKMHFVGTVVSCVKCGVTECVQKNYCATNLASSAKVLRRCGWAMDCEGQMDAIRRGCEAATWYCPICKLTTDICPDCGGVMKEIGADLYQTVDRCEECGYTRERGM